MITTGFSKRSISDQANTFGYNIDVRLDNLTGHCKLGISGSRDFGFTFQHGRIYDPDDRFVSSYESGKWVNISGQVGQASYDYYINSEPIAIGNNIGTGKYSWAYVNAAGVEADSNIQIFGELPEYSTSPTGYYSGSGHRITGQIVNLNPDVSFRLFDIEQREGSPYGLDGFTTGDISNTGYFYLTGNQDITPDILLPLRFYTNFGEIDVQYSIVGHQPVYSTVYLTVSPFENTIINGQNKLFTAYLANYPDDAEVSVTLEYISGVTGNIYQSVSVTNPKVQTISGIVSGRQALVTYYTGEVTGLDPLTNTIETGQGTGYLFSAIIEATGEVSQSYTVEGSGYGEGLYKGDIYAKGTGDAPASGEVGILGGYSSPVVVEDVEGTGSSPFYYEGIMPKATGQAFLHPTGMFRLSEPLFAESGHYVSGNIEVSKIYEGWLYKDYTLIAVGYATGEYITGRVKSNFHLEFEPGYYVFSKQFSGVVHSEYGSMATFNPASCTQENATSSGILAGLFTWPPNASLLNPTGEGGYLDCLQLTGLPTIAFTGIPDMVYGTGHIAVPNHQIVLVIPNDGFDPRENSESVLTGYLSRTQTSRMGVTPSGTGYFREIIQDCLYPSGDWRESLESHPTGFLDDSTNVGIDYLAATCQSHCNTYFTISGEEKQRNLLFKTDTPNSDSKLYLYKISGSTETLVAYNDNWITGGYTTTRYLYENNAAPSSSFDSAIYAVLGEGDYVLKSVATQIGLSGGLFFSKSVYSGCENWGYIPIRINRTGDFKDAITGQLKFYLHTNEAAIPNVDFWTGNVGFNFAPSQSSLVVKLPIYDDGDKEQRESFGVFIEAYYDGTQINALTTPNYANVYILDDDDDEAFVMHSGYCASGPHPYGGGPSSPIYDPVPNPPLPEPIAGGHGAEGMGDVHLIIRGAGVAPMSAPFNIDDNISIARLLYFYADGYSVSYEQSSYPWVEGGYAITRILITTPTSSVSLSAENANALGGGPSAVYSLGNFGSLSVKLKDAADCGLEAYSFFEISLYPSMGWYEAETIGGAFYYLLKAASSMVGAVNNPAGGNVDGISNFLSPFGKTRYHFESSDLELSTEPTSKSVIDAIFAKWNEFMTTEGSWDGEYDPLVTDCGECFNEFSTVRDALEHFGEGDVILSYRGMTPPLHHHYHTYCHRVVYICPNSEDGQPLNGGVIGMSSNPEIEQGTEGEYIALVAGAGVTSESSVMRYYYLEFYGHRENYKGEDEVRNYVNCGMNNYDVCYMGEIAG